MPKQKQAELITKEQLTSDIYKFSIKVPEIVEEAKSGNL